MRLNTTWIRQRIASRKCQHRWETFMKGNEQHCAKCGVWRWYPIIRRMA